jgi:putative NADH-flavin reductase
MKIVVFGATGRSGLPFVEQALEQGHTIVALARSPEKMPITHDRLQVVKGDVTDANAVDQAIAGADAVVSVIGHTKETPRDMQVKAAQNIVGAMKKHGLRRVIVMTGAGVPDAADQPKFFDNLMRFMLKTINGDVLQDSLNYAEVIRNSGLDWTIVRVPMLTDGAPTGNLRVGVAGTIGPRLVRADGATFILKQLADAAYVGKSPAISN